MKFSTMFSTAVLATSISAAAIKPTRTRHTHPNMRRIRSGNANITANDQSGNWAGGVLTAPPSGQTFNAVSGKFVVPQPAVPDGADASAGAYTGTAWVGIDGDTYQGAILQAGVDWSVDASSGSPQYNYFAWTEWIPNAQVAVDGLTINSGDTVSVEITSQSDTTGTVVITDETSGQSVTTSISAPNAQATLQGVNAEWIVEDYTISSGLAPFANYGSVALTDCAAGTPGGSVDGTGADLLDMTDSNGNVVSSTNQVSGSEFDVTYQ